MSQWGQGRATIDQMLVSGQLERVPPNREAADAFAGTCVSQDATLATRNTAAFAGVPGLRLIDPFA